MKKIVGLFFLMGTFMFSQSKVQIGGGLGLGFGDQTTIEIAPNVAYRILPNVDVGVEANYTYNKDDNFKQNAYGGGVFARPYFGNFFGYGSYKINQVNTDIDLIGGGTREDDRTVDELWLGGGYRTNLGGVTMYAGAMYDVLHNDDSLYSSGFRPYVGVGIGL
ncbi:hypothetical protein UJ101_00902 [Flavobacteriaceae bacterium UJ101]|nr:hypothetical protein UJ101_00902 [Flavobacteriaceae bacterium UJ101]